jgi:hypothetical protein
VPALDKLDISRLLAVLQYLTLLFFVAGGVPFLAGRRHLRRLAIAAYGCAIVLALVWVAVWLAQPLP